MTQILPGGPVPAMPEQVSTDQSQMPIEGESPITATQGVSDEQKQSLLDLIGSIREKLGTFKATKFAGDGAVEKMRSSLLQQVFEKMQLAGVDLTSQESVAAFMERLKQTSPELTANFEKAMEILLGGSGMPGAPQDPTESMDLGISPQNNMNNENQYEENSQTTENIPQG